MDTIMKYILNIYEPIIWLLVLFCIIVGVFLVILTYKMCTHKTVDEWLVLSTYCSFSLLLLSYYFPNDTFIIALLPMLLVPFGVKAANRYKYRIKRKKELQNLRDETVFESDVDKYFNNEELAQIRQEAKECVKCKTGKYMMVICGPTALFIIICLIRGMCL